jgi:hypothetical protein
MSFYHSIGGTSALVGLVAGALITYLISRFYANRIKIAKVLGWTPLSLTRIVRQRVTDVAKGLALTWNGNPLETPYTVRLRISNIGAKEIIGKHDDSGSSDYSTPLSVNFGKSVCYECTISNGFEVPIEIPSQVELGEPASTFKVDMPTLNISSWIELEMIADGEPEFPDLSCLIVGQTKQIELVAARRASRIQSAALVTGGLVRQRHFVIFDVIGADGAATA